MQKLHWILCIGGFLLLVSTSARAVPASISDDDSYVADGEGDYPDDGDYKDKEEEESEDSQDSFSGQPAITSEPLKLEVDENDKVELPCKGENLKQIALLWYKGSIKNTLIAGEYRTTTDPRIQMDGDGATLKIFNVTAKDSGDYTCTAGGENSVVKVTHSIRVRQIPTATIDEKNRVVKQSEPVTLSCNVTGYPEPVVYWERRGKKMPNGEQTTQARDITFPAVSRHHSGFYECFANNSMGAAATATNLVVMHPPEIEIERDSVNSGKGYDAELACIVHAEPKATVVWYKDGVQVKLTEDKHEFIQKLAHVWILHITGVEVEDFGNYTCVANNVLGRVNGAILLSGAPSQPIVKESGVGEDNMSYKLVWTMESTVPVDAYKIRFRKVDEAWEEMDVKGDMIQANVYRVSHTFQDLNPSSEYEVTMYAHNEYGNSREARASRFHINREFQSLEADSEPQAKGATGGSSPISSLSPLLLALALVLSFHLPGHLRWK